ncbi:MAG: MCE family protein [Actinomycetota bacterium]|nr:MCE family protein [Actinomycetota bacterium]
MSLVRALFYDRLYLSAFGVLTVLVVCVAYLFASVLEQPLTSQPVRVTVMLGNTGGLFEGSAVTYRGVKIGKVTDIAITRDGVRADLRLGSGTEVPTDSIAKVRSLSPVGEQYLDFQPNTDDGPFLADGATVSAAHTDLPKTLSSTVLAVDKLMRQIDDRKLRSFLVELGTGLRGTGDNLGRLVDQGDLILTELDRVWPQTDRLLRNSDPVLDIGTDSATALEELGTSARQLAAFLRDYDPELRHTLQRAPDQLAQLEALVEDADKVLPGFLDVGVSLTDIFALHDPHLRALLQVYGPGLGVLSRVIRDGEVKLELIGDKDPRCRYDTPRRHPRDPTRVPLNEHAACAASFATLQRGAAHAPGPVRR